MDRVTVIVELLKLLVLEGVARGVEDFGAEGVEGDVEIVHAVHYTVVWGGCQRLSERNREFATFVLPTGYDPVKVELSEVVGHFETVDAELRARLAVGRPGQAAAVLFDGVEESGEARGEVLLLHVFHYPYYRHDVNRSIGKYRS